MDFLKVLNILIKDEGGFTLHKVAGDTGGLTYAGITRKHHPDWKGWDYIDQNELINKELYEAVGQFYKKEYWNKIKADSYEDYHVKNQVMNFSVNSGTKTAIRLMQKVLGTKTDGLIGPITLKHLNNMDPVIFCEKYTLAKINFYAKICNRKSNQKKFLLGWINRAFRCLNKKV